MRLLLVSDLHYALKQYDWTAAAAPAFDLVVIAGDHLDISSALGGDVQVLVILKYLQRLARTTQLVVSSGNHDLDRRGADGERIPAWIERVRRLGVPTDGDTLELEAARVTICPWWDGPAAKAAIAEQLARDASKPRRPWIWVYHAPPDGSPTSWDGRRSWGDADLSAWIEAYRPDIVLTGHIHQAPFKRDGSWVDRIGETWVFNAGQQIGPEPPYVIIDTDEPAAAWFSLAGAEAVRLDQPLTRPVASLSALPSWMPAIPGPGPTPG